MAKLLSDQTANELPAIFETVRNIQQETRGRPIRRDRGGGGGAERPYIIITEVLSPDVYVGNVLTAPDDSAVVEVGVSIRAKSATANAFNVGYDTFSDLVGDNYWIDGALLG